jgi:TonB-linked SusC/RagA family outer membrane protein
MKKIFDYYESQRLSGNWAKLLLTMRITAFLIFIGVMDLFSAPSYSQNTKISLDMKNASIEDVLSKIEDSSEFYFLFNQKLIDVNRKVDVKANKKPIKDILSDIFDDDINFIVYDRQIILTPANGSVGTPEFLQKKVMGRVTDESTGEPLPGVNVRIEGSSIGTITDGNGSYSIEVSMPDAVLQFSFIGYVSQSTAVAGKEKIDISLKPDVSRLDEVIVVGYGTQSKRSVTGSIQSVNSEELANIPVTTMAQKLQGKLAGVQINQTTGKPGQGMQIRIRGQASLTAGNDPLYVVDGFPLTGDISGINPNEIESISVLKDASSAALYGSRAANGVIMVTTKKAKAGKTSIGLTAYYGWQEVPEKGRPEMMNGTEFAQFKKESYEDRGQPVPVQFQNPGQYGEGYNYYDALLRVAPIQDYSLSLSSGKDNFSTTAVLGYFNQDGVVINSYYKRYSLRLNSEYKISEKIKAGFNAAPTYSINNTPNTDGQFWASGLVNNSLLTWPIFPYENPDGTLPMMSWDPTISAFPTPNYYRAAQEIINETKTTRLLANTYIQFEPVVGLVLKSTLNFDLGNTKYDNIVPSTTSAGFATVLPTTSNAAFRSGQYGSWLNENTITYTKSLNDHHFEILGGFTIQEYRSEIQQIAVTGFPDDRVPTVGAAANINRSGTTNTYNDIQEWSMMSYLGRLNYNFKNKYLLSAVVRADGSSRFGSDKRWGTFPSISAGWIVSEEGFMKDNNTVSLLKLRASYGLVGNNNIGNYTQYATVSSGSSGYNAIFGSSLASGSAVTSMPNSLLTWEQSQEMDLGFDLGLYKNRLNIGYDYYNRRTKSLLYSVNVAQESGFASYM